MTDPSKGISREDVVHLANLARIDLSDAELDGLAAELPVILESVAKVQEIAGAEVAAMSHPLPVINVFRPDEVRESLTVEEALSGAPGVEQERFLVPRILGEDA